MQQSIYTRCPECSTVFRVTEEHLKLAKGRVRCGACLAIFKATEYLVRPKTQPGPLVAEATQTHDKDSTSKGAEANESSTTAETDPVVENTTPLPAIDTSVAESLPNKAFEDNTADLHFPQDGEDDPLDSLLDDLEAQGEDDPPLSFPEPQSNDEDTTSSSEVSESLNDNQIDLDHGASDFGFDNGAELSMADDLTQLEELSIEQDLLANETADNPDRAEPAESHLQADQSGLASASGNEQTEIADSALVAAIDESHTGELANEKATVDDSSSDDDSNDEPSIDELLDKFDTEISLGSETPSSTSDDQISISDTEPVSVSGDSELLEDDQRADDSDGDSEFGGLDDLATDFDSLDFPEHDLPENDLADDDLPDSELSDGMFDDQQVGIDQLGNSLQDENFEPDPLDEFDDMVQHKSQKFKWLAASLLIIAAFVWGAVALWQDRQTLAYDETWGGLVTTMCSIVPCQLQPRQEIKAIELLERNITSNEQNPDISEFSLLLKNTASFSQPYPVVRIIFTDSNGETVAEELHLPSEYLAAEFVNTTMPVNQPVHILVTAKNSYANAFGFEFSFQ
ncbi:MAG: zinc-ribbon and DUF3426 domain-containing protein [Kangiellaceae bacterium]|jgi:predicted Zn finger-like uncharacterized protein|nr:zinc-ribbon and DUF3426 domain-containing protein [Kangiellaceae bacterium]